MNSTDAGTCEHQCSDSGNCSTGHICCFNGCGSVCVVDPGEVYTVFLFGKYKQLCRIAKISVAVTHTI